MTLFQFYKEFDTEKKCSDYLLKIRWGGKIICPFCGSEKYYITKNRSTNTKADSTDVPHYKCGNTKGCRKKFTVTTNTLLHSTNAPLVQFFFIIFSSCVNKKKCFFLSASIKLRHVPKMCMVYNDANKENMAIYIQYFNARMNDKSYQILHELTLQFINKIDNLPDQIRLQMADMIRSHEVIKQLLKSKS